jgi:hypothetical protein
MASGNRFSDDAQAAAHDGALAFASKARQYHRAT